MKNNMTEQILKEFDEFYIQIKPTQLKDSKISEALQDVFDYLNQKEKLEMKKWLKTSLQTLEKEVRKDEREKVLDEIIQLVKTEQPYMFPETEARFIKDIKTIK